MPDVSSAVLSHTALSNTEHEAETEALASDELLVEEISIDGMCGVY